jgi:hypothetical protein
MKRFIKVALREGLSIMSEDYFNPTIDKDDKARSKRYFGRNVEWYGIPGKMIVIHKDYVHGMWGNLYDNKKLDYLRDLILDYPDRIELECSYGIGSVVTLQDITEHQISVAVGDWEIDYEGHSEPYSIGDELLDKYLGVESLDDDGDLFELQGYDNYEIMSLMDGYKTLIASKLATKEEFMEEIIDLPIDLTEADKETIQYFFEYEDRVRDAVENEEGDMNDFSVQLRDGHHRVFGAIAAGENYVCVNIDDDSLEKYREYLQLVK